VRNARGCREKARTPKAPADAFAVASAVEQGATLVTMDPEIDHLGSSLLLVEKLSRNRT
jgi:hypothetical protein